MMTKTLTSPAERHAELTDSQLLCSSKSPGTRARGVSGPRAGFGAAGSRRSSRKVPGTRYPGTSTGTRRQSQELREPGGRSPNQILLAPTEPRAYPSG